MQKGLYKQTAKQLFIRTRKKNAKLTAAAAAAAASIRRLPLLL